jgi:Tol biopolymer transport system component
MKHRLAKSVRQYFAALTAAGLCFGLAGTLRAGFVYESPTEFFSAGDFNGDGIADVLVLDKTTGNARVGYSDGNGGLTWSAPLVTGVENVTGLGVQHFLATTNDSIAVTAPNFNHVNLVDLSQTNTAGTPQTFATIGVGPHALAGLASPLTPSAGGLPYLFVASSLNNASSEMLDFMQWHVLPVYLGQFNETGPFDRINALDLNTNTATFAVGLMRGATNDELHVWQFTNSPAVMLVFSNLPAGSDYAFGNFTGEALPRFIFYQLGGSNLTMVPLLETNGGYAFGASLNVSLSEAVEGVFTVNLGTSNGSAILQFGDGVQGLTLPGGSPALSAKYQTGTGAAGNVFVGIVPLANGMFALLDAPAGAASSTHAQVIKFDGTNFTQRSSSNLSSVSSRQTRANVWLFQLEPFVNRSPGFIASLNSPDWADGVGGLPGAVKVPTEADAGSTNGLGNVSTNNLGVPPGGAAFGIANQYNPAISLFSYSIPKVAEPVQVTISPPPGSYGSPLAIAFTATPAAATIAYRVGPVDDWHFYASPFSITNDETIEYYGINISGVRSSLQTAGYSLGSPSATGSNAVFAVAPGSTNTPPILSTNQLIISQNGTVFYGRRSTANVGTIWAINLDGSGDTYITTGVRPRVTADGRWLAFLREGNPFGSQGNVWLRDLKSGAEQRLLVNLDSITGYDWELNEAALLMDYACGIRDLHTNGIVNAVINSDCYDEAPVRNPVDGRIAFHNLNPDSSIAGLYVASANGSGRQRILSSVPGASWPAWSPDGGDLVFADSNNTGENAGKNLWLMYPDGTGLLQISGFTDATNGFPHGAIWSPDDATLVTAGTIFGTNGLWLIPLTPDHMECDGEPIRLPTSPGDAIDFAGSVVVASAPGVLLSTTTAPGLFIRQTPDAVVIYWSTNFTGYMLESEASLSPAAWTPISGPYYLAGQYFEHWESRDSLSAQKYFRLQAPGEFVLSQPPVLTIQIQASIAVLSWPTGLTGFKLQSKASLDATVPWTDLDGPIINSGTNYEYFDPTATIQGRFYRLRGP